MRLTKTFQLAISSIISNKMRSFLTMLGVIIGIMAVIVLVSIMSGVTGQITDLFESIGTDSITVSIMPRGGNREVRAKDMYAFVEENPEHFTHLSPTVSVQASSVKSTESTDSLSSTTVTGVSEEYDEMKKYELTQGRFLQYLDVKTNAKVCVIGTYVEQELFGTGKSMGQTVKINGVGYTVVGVLEEQGDSSEGSSDDAILMPYTSAEKLNGSSQVSAYTLTVADVDNIAVSKALLEAQLTQWLGDDFYNVMAMSEMLDEMNKMMNTMTMALVAIAAISLLVGGIGIMNIMLVSVTERTREIGIRKSLGAKNRTILQQFVIEAGTVSGLGGIFGIILGAVLSMAAGKLLNITVVPSTGAILISFSVSVAIGVMFGYLPAKKAAQLNPIDALRYE